MKQKGVFVGFAALFCAAILMGGSPASSAPNAVAVEHAVVTRGSTPAWGTGSNIYYTMTAWDAHPIDSSFTYNYTSLAGFVEGITRSNSTGSQWVHAPLHLPSGASLSKIEFHYCDTGTATFSAFLFTQPKNGDTLGVTDLITSSGTPGCVVDTATFGPVTIDNDANSYFIEINMGENTDGSIVFESARAGYNLQVSPAPATATFGDVPISDPGFQYVEALFASGITAGCGGGNYCPDNPLTRRQMAVFLAKAFGLHWPN